MRHLLIVLIIFGAQTFAFPSTPTEPAQILTPFANLNDNNKQKIEQLIRPKAFAQPFPDSGRKQAVMEYESLPSKKETSYGRLHDFVASFYNPKPVVDVTKEHEKYGNDGSKGRAVGTAIIGAYEGLSNVLNAAAEVPFEVIKQIGRKVTISLNTIGGKVVGLA